MYSDLSKESGLTRFLYFPLNLQPDCMIKQKQKQKRKNSFTTNPNKQTKGKNDKINEKYPLFSEDTVPYLRTFLFGVVKNFCYHAQ